MAFGAFDLSIHVVLSQFPLMRRYLACHRIEDWFYRFLDCKIAGEKGPGPVHLLLNSATEIGWSWDVTRHALFILTFLGPVRGAWLAPLLRKRQGVRRGMFQDIRARN